MIVDKLHDYQQTGFEWLARKKRGILADEMGLGKTVQAIEAMRVLRPQNTLIVCTKVGTMVWLDELKKWWPEALKGTAVILGQPHKRRKILSECQTYPIVITTYDILRIDLDLFTQSPYLVIFDEGHKFRNRKTLTFKTIKKLKPEAIFILTGTPVSRGAQDLWSLLNVIAPNVFGSYWRFVNTFCIIEENYWGGKEITGVRNPEALRRLLKEYLLRRTKVQVLPELPPKTRQLLTVELPTRVRKVYDDLVENMIAELEDALIVVPTVLVQLIRLRQLLTCPLLLAKDRVLEYGPIDVVAEHLDENKHAVIFTPFAKALPIFEQRLRHLGFEHIITLKGGMKPEDVRSSIQAFEDDRGIALCTIKFAQSFSLSSATKAFFIGYEYNPDENYQAEDRLHRVTTKSAVNIYYIKHENTVDEQLLEILDDKQENVNQILRSPKRLKQLLARKQT